jgi:hypothetical protein
MIDTDRIRKEVADYHIKNAVGDTSADAFAAWWLTRRFEIAPIDAVKRAPGGNHDFGLDGFHLEVQGERVILHLVQGKFTSQISEIKKGFLGFERTMEVLEAMMSGRFDAPQQNSVIARLGSLLEREKDLISRLQLHFRVLHLSDADTISLEQNLDSALQKFSDAAVRLLPLHRCVPVYRFPGDELADGLDRAVNPANPDTIRFAGEPLSAGDGIQYYSGLGYLSDLVDLYHFSREALFAKNVRCYLRRKEDHGPAKHMRDTLRRVCIDKRLDPARFAILHNGVTLHATYAKKTDSGLEVRGVSVLNGCQTIVNAHRFKEDRNLKPRIDDAQWKRIPLPLRVLVTGDEDAVRQVAISNNRQIAIRSSAFRANDPTQLRLAERFKEVGVFYERQEGAFDNIRDTENARFEDTYPNSFDRPLKMEELAQAIAVVTDEFALSTACKSDLFEDPIYPKVFAEQYIGDLAFLIFLRNVLVVMPLALKDVRKKNTVLSDLPPGRFRFPCTKILVRYICKYHSEMIQLFGRAVIGRVGVEDRLRVRLRQLMAAANTGLQQLLPEVWLDTGGGKVVWRSATDPCCINQVLKQLRLNNVDVFSLAASAVEA